MRNGIYEGDRSLPHTQITCIRKDEQVKRLRSRGINREGEGRRGTCGFVHVRSLICQLSSSLTWALSTWSVSVTKQAEQASDKWRRKMWRGKTFLRFVICFLVLLEIFTAFKFTFLLKFACHETHKFSCFFFSRKCQVCFQNN